MELEADIQKTNNNNQISKQLNPHSNLSTINLFPLKLLMLSHDASVMKIGI